MPSTRLRGSSVPEANHQVSKIYWQNRLRELGFGTTGNASFATYLSSPQVNSMTMRKIFCHGTTAIVTGRMHPRHTDSVALLARQFGIA